MLNKRILFTLTALICLLSVPANLLACACCAEPGTYFISTSKPDEYKLGLLGEMKFDKTAVLYTDARGFEDFLGLDPLKKEFASDDLEGVDQFDLVNSFASKMWKFTLKSKGGKSGMLTLPVPAQMVSFKVDIHDGEPNTETSLYKEFRFKGTVAGGTGIFKAGIISPTTYFLVFQGRGNNCDNSFDFTHWHLEINGKKANYSFYGKMATEEPN